MFHSLSVQNLLLIISPMILTLNCTNKVLLSIFSPKYTIRIGVFNVQQIINVHFWTKGYSFKFSPDKINQNKRDG